MVSSNACATIGPTNEATLIYQTLNMQNAQKNQVASWSHSFKILRVWPNMLRFYDQSESEDSPQLVASTAQLELPRKAGISFPRLRG